MTVKRHCLLAGLILIGIAGALRAPRPAWAQEGSDIVAGAVPGASGAEAAIKEGLSVKEIYESGGWLMHVLSGMSVLALALVIHLFAALRTDRIAPKPLRRDILEKVGADAIDDARRACEYRSCPLSDIFLAATDYMRAVPNVDPALLKDVVEGEGRRQAEAIQGRTQYLLDIAVISPMVGLLGTVFGMLRAFNAVALDIAKAKPILLAAGVSQALITTAYGLMVGIPAMMFYAYFRQSASKSVSHLESASSEVFTALLGGKSQ